MYVCMYVCMCVWYSEMWDSMVYATKSIVPGSNVIGLMLPGATDGRYFRSEECGIAAKVYGANLMTPSETFGKVMGCFHGKIKLILMKLHS